MSVPEMHTGSNNSSTTAAAAMNQAYVTSAIQSIRPEYSIASARASVLTYDDSIRKWIPRGTSSGLSKVHIYQNRFQHTFRVVGRKLDDHEVVINCLILKDLKYIKATPTFHQWRESQSIYGLNFKSKEDADIFANAMDNALETLNNNVINDNCSKSTSTISSIGSNTAAVVEEDMRYRSMTREEAQNYQDKCQFIHESHNNNNNISHHQSNGGNSHYRVSSICNASIPSSITSSQSSLTSLTASLATNASVSASNNNNHNATENPYSSLSEPNRTSVTTAPTSTSTSLAPPIVPSSQASGTNHTVPLPPSMPTTSNASTGIVGAGANAAANCRPAPPPPPPPPPMPSMLDTLPNGNDPNATSMFALQLQNAKLKKQSNPVATKPMVSAIGSSAVPPAASNGMASMMDEITKTIARRRAAVEKNDSMATNGGTAAGNSSGNSNNWEKSNTLPNQGKHFESPKSIRKRFGNSAQQQPENGTMPKPPPFNSNGYNTITKNFSGSVAAAAAASNGGGGNSTESSSSSLLVNSQQNSSDSDFKTAEIISEIKKEMHKIKLEIIDALRQELNRR